MGQHNLINTAENIPGTVIDNSSKCTLENKERITLPPEQKQIISHCISIELSRLEKKLPEFIYQLLATIRPQFPSFIFRFTQGFHNLHIHVMPTQKLDAPKDTMDALEHAIKQLV